MQEVLIIPKNELLELIGSEVKKGLEQLKAEINKPNEEFYTCAQAAKLLRITEAGLRKARREGRIKGQQRNAKSWEFSRSELERFQNRYNRET